MVQGPKEEPKSCFNPVTQVLTGIYFLYLFFIYHLLDPDSTQRYGNIIFLNLTRYSAHHATPSFCFRAEISWLDTLAANFVSLISTSVSKQSFPVTVTHKKKPLHSRRDT